MDTIYKNRTYQFDVIVKVNDQTVDVSQDKVILTIDTKSENATPKIVKEADVSSGVAEFELTPTETATLELKEHFFQVHWELFGTNRKFSVIHTKVKVETVIK